MIKFIYILFFLHFLPHLGFSQLMDTMPYQYKENFSSEILDSIPHIWLPEVLILPDQKTWTRQQQRKYSILEKRVRKVYPMAKVAAFRLAEYNRVYMNFSKEKERKQYIKQIEKQLFKEFEDEIRHMTVSEGRILIKLIDRETGKNSYEIIKEFKGGFSAFFWQSIARLFGHNLKASYDRENEDKMIEYIVMQLDMGWI